MAYEMNYVDIYCFEDVERLAAGMIAYAEQNPMDQKALVEESKQKFKDSVVSDSGGILTYKGADISGSIAEKYTRFVKIYDNDKQLAACLGLSYYVLSDDELKGLRYLTINDLNLQNLVGSMANAISHCFFPHGNVKTKKDVPAYLRVYVQLPEDSPQEKHLIKPSVN